MTNKTITLSSETVERITRYLPRGVKGSEELIDTLRAALAEPVPPAGWEPEIVGQLDTGGFEGRVSEPLIRLYDHRAHVTRLQAEVDQVTQFRDNAVNKIHRLRNELTGVEKERDALQSELTKARELFTDLKESAARSLPDHLYSRICEFLHSNQSAPGLIQTLHANGDRIAMEAIIAQQAQRIADLEADKGHGEPVAYRWRVKGHGEWTTSICKVEFDARANDDRFVAQALYAEQPAPVAVALTDDQILEAMRSEIYKADGGYVFDTAKEYVIAAGRALIDEVARLNGLKL